MRVTELIKLMPTQFRQATDNPLVSGHHIPQLGSWTQADGFKKKQILEYQGESLACPIIAVVEEKIGGEDLVLNITAKTSEFDSFQQKVQGEYTLKRKKYIPTSNTVSTTLTIPRHTRPWAVYLLTGLGKNVYDISSITDNAVANVGRVNFYALASNGSRIIYWLGLFRLAETLREILNAIWIAPTKCIRCGGTGIEPDTTSDTCLQCNGYRFSGHNATKFVQRKKGLDVGLAREVLDWDNLTEADHSLIKKFINKAWTQKWWVTPTEKEIKRLFAHFYQVTEDEIIIEKRFHPQEPVWHLSLPLEAGEASPFGVIDEADRDLMEFIAESVTPAGVNVFVGFYFTGDFGNLEDFQVGMPNISYYLFDTSAFMEKFVEWGVARWKDWNGWVEAIDNFETEDEQLDPAWDIIGNIEVIQANDMHRTVVKLEDNAYMQRNVAGQGFPGSMSIWMHPDDCNMRFGTYATGIGQWLDYIEWDNASNSFKDRLGNTLRIARSNQWYHIGADIRIVSGTGQSDLYVERERLKLNVNWATGHGAETPVFRIQTTGIGVGYIDGFNVTPNSFGKSRFENWQTLYPAGWGWANTDYATGQSGTIMETDLFNKYISRDQFWDVFEP